MKEHDVTITVKNRNATVDEVVEGCAAFLRHCVAERLFKHLGNNGDGRIVGDVAAAHARLEHDNIADGKVARLVELESNLAHLLARGHEKLLLVFGEGSKAETPLVKVIDNHVTVAVQHHQSKVKGLLEVRASRFVSVVKRKKKGEN